MKNYNNHTVNYETKTKKFWVHLSTIELVDDIKLLSVYLKLKSFDNSTYYNYKAYRFSKFIGMSDSTTARYVRKLVSLGLIVKHHGNITAVGQHRFLSQKQMYRKGWRLIEISSIENLKSQQYMLLLKQEEARQRRAIKKRIKDLNKIRERSNPDDPATKSQELFLQRNFIPEMIFSTRGLGKLFNVSHTKANQILKELQSTGLINMKNKYEVIGHINNPVNSDERSLVKSTKGFNIERDEQIFGHLFVKGNRIYVHRGRVINILSHSSPIDAPLRGFPTGTISEGYKV